MKSILILLCLFSVPMFASADTSVAAPEWDVYQEEAGEPVAEVAAVATKPDRPFNVTGEDHAQAERVKVVYLPNNDGKSISATAVALVGPFEVGWQSF